MQTRLACSVAAHLEPEILILDEVLSVGDADFQKKCLGKMSEAWKTGRTVLFVSHSMSAADQLCDRVRCLDHGAPLLAPRHTLASTTQMLLAYGQGQYLTDVS